MFTYYDMYEFLFNDCNFCYYECSYCHSDVCEIMYDITRSFIPVLIYR